MESDSEQQQQQSIIDITLVHDDIQQIESQDDDIVVCECISSIRPTTLLSSVIYRNMYFLF
jgi:hypothetical protein